jgi:hypothetical protein
VSIALPWPWRGRGVKAHDDEGRLNPAPGAGALADARFGGDRDDGPAPWELVYVAGTIEEAYIVKGALEAADVPAVLRYEALGRVMGPLTMHGVDVLVPRVLADRARDVLDGSGEAAPHRHRRRHRGRSDPDAGALK